jgi:hypothetical protein
LTPYWILFAVWAIGATQFARRAKASASDLLFWGAALLTGLMIGLRFEVGGDWFTYLDLFDQISFQPLLDGLMLSDAGYAFFNWISAQLQWGIWLPNTACALAFTWGIAKLAKQQPNPWLAMLIAVPYLIIVVAMGYTRQGAAIGIVCLALADASEKRVVRLIVIIGIASLFHKTAILILPVVLLPVLRQKPLWGVLGGIAFVLLFVLVLRDSSRDMVNNYALSSYDSQGAAIRVAMNVVAAIVILVFRQRMGLPPFQYSYWIANAVLAIASVPALLSLSASSGVDRLALFLIPMQMVAYSRLPYILSRDRSSNAAVFLGLVAYSFAVQFVWLNYAVNAQLWLPYKTFLPME